jgi:hypothetical protein
MVGSTDFMSVYDPNTLNGCDRRYSLSRTESRSSDVNITQKFVTIERLSKNSHIQEFGCFITKYNLDGG